MPVLVANKPFSSAAPTVTVENALKAGSHRFQLVVVDDSGNESTPNELTVIVRDPAPPPPPPGTVKLDPSIFTTQFKVLNPTIPIKNIKGN